MPLINSQLRTPGGPGSHRPHILLVLGLAVFLAVALIVGGWA